MGRLLEVLSGEKTNFKYESETKKISVVKYDFRES